MIEKCPMCHSDAIVREYKTLTKYIQRCMGCDYTDSVEYKDEKGESREFNGKP